MKSVQQLPDVEFQHHSTASLQLDRPSREELKEEYKQTTSHNNPSYAETFGGANPFATGAASGLPLRAEIQSVPTANQAPGAETTEQLIARVQNRFQETKDMLE